MEEETAEKVEREKESERKDFWRKLPNGTRWFIAICIGVVILYIYRFGFQQMKNILIGIAIFIGIILFTQQQPDSKTLTEEECKSILREKIQSKMDRRTGEFPEGEFRIMEVGGQRDFLDEKKGAVPWYRDLGAEFVGKNYLKKVYRISMFVRGPNRGDIKNIRFMPFGFDGREVKDVKYLVDKEAERRKKMDEYYAKTKR